MTVPLQKGKVLRLLLPLLYSIKNTIIENLNFKSYKSHHDGHNPQKKPSELDGQR
jgi:hypothetical protein